MFPKCKKLLSGFALLMALVIVSSFSENVGSENFKWIQDRLNTHFDVSAETVKMKKWEINVTDKGFFRFRKFLVNGKQEYFSFHLKRFQDIVYLGNVSHGKIILKTKSDDIIVQTYNDPKGNIDSMSGELSIPVMNIEPEVLDSLKNCIEKVRDN